VKLEGLTILVVEDDMLIQADLVLSLQRQGAQTIAAGTVEDGLAAIGPDLNISVLDILLGDTTVMPIAEKLHDIGIPFLFHSAIAGQSDYAAAFPNAIMLSKPASESLLIDSILEVAKG